MHPEQPIRAKKLISRTHPHLWPRVWGQAQPQADFTTKSDFIRLPKVFGKRPKSLPYSKQMWPQAMGTSYLFKMHTVNSTTLITLIDLPWAVFSIDAYTFSA